MTSTTPPCGSVRRIFGVSLPRPTGSFLESTKRGALPLDIDS